jgi:signal transduction histidine kinase
MPVFARSEQSGNRPLAHTDTVSDVLGALNTRALQVGRVLGPVFALGYFATFALTRHIAYLAVGSITLTIGATCARRLRSGRGDAEFLIAASGIAIFLLWPVAADIVRGTLSAGLVLIAMIGAIVLPHAGRVRTTALFGLLIAGQLAWPLMGVTAPAATALHVAISALALFLGLQAVRIARGMLEASAEKTRVHAQRFKNIFERAPVAIWEEDWSGILPALEELRARGITDLRRHLLDNPDEFMRVWETIRYLDANPAAMELVGAITKEEAIANVRPEPPPSPIAESFIDEFVAISSGVDHMSFDANGTTVDGRPLDLHCSWIAARAADGSLDLNPVLVVMTDITALRRTQRRLDQTMASKDQLVASVSHELRTPITAIMGMAFELRDNAGEFSADEAAELMSLIADQSSEVALLVEDLMVAARADLKTLVVRPEKLNVRAELQQIMAANPPGGVPTIDVPVDITAWADSLRFRQIIRNLLSNAQRYGGDTVRVEANVGGGGRVAVRVIDDGEGVPADKVEMVFEPYSRATSEKIYPGSMGLGLAVSRRLARLMGGDLTYRYENGSVFEITLPSHDRHKVAV